ncbi:MAG: hypothetical protein RLZZ50_229 [Verrucomicrobiota bacterium]|jgi:hypothetical protein
MSAKGTERGGVHLVRLGYGREAILAVARRSVTPFGGLAVLVEFWRELRLLQAVRERLPFEYRPPNAPCWNNASTNSKTTLEHLPLSPRIPSAIASAA